MPNRIDYESWMAIPVTQWFMREIRNLRESKREVMANGQTYNSESAEKTHGNTAMAIGYIQGIDEIMDIRPENYEEQDEEDE